MTKNGNGEGSIYRWRDGWRGQITVDGKKRKSFVGKTKAEVLKQMVAAQVAKQEGRLSAEPSQSVAEYLTAWLELTKGTVRESSHMQYDLHVRRLLPHLGRVRLDKLAPAHVQRCYQELGEAGLSARSILQVHRILHAALKKAMRLGLINRNVTEMVDPPRVPRGEMHTYSMDELACLLQVTAGERLHALWVVLGTSGLRLGEALGLKWADIDWDRQTATVRRSVQQQVGKGAVFTEPKTSRSRRTVELGASTCQVLREHKVKQLEQRLRAPEWVEHDLVFCTDGGRPLLGNNVRAVWQRTVERAGLRYVRIHDLRHTVASLWLEQGVHPKVVQERLGHSSIALTLDTYSHVAPTMQREAADHFESRLVAARKRIS